MVERIKLRLQKYFKNKWIIFNQIVTLVLVLRNMFAVLLCQNIFL